MAAALDGASNATGRLCDNTDVPARWLAHRSSAIPRPIALSRDMTDVPAMWLAHRSSVVGLSNVEPSIPGRDRCASHVVDRCASHVAGTSVASLSDAKISGAAHNATTSLAMAALPSPLHALRGTPTAVGFPIWAFCYGWSTPPTARRSSTGGQLQ